MQAQLDEVCLGDLFVLVHVLPGRVLLYVHLRPEAVVYSENLDSYPRSAKLSGRTPGVSCCSVESAVS